MTNTDDDPLIAEIEKLQAEYRYRMLEEQDEGSVASRILSVLGYLRQFALADRARQQVEKEKMIVELKDASTSMQIDNMGNTATAIELEDVIAIIQGKEQKEERVIE